MGQVCGKSKVQVQPNEEEPAGQIQPPQEQDHALTTEMGARGIIDDDDDEVLRNGAVPHPQHSGLLRLCLLGTTESGKTTVFEQIRKLSKIPVPAFELQLRKTFIYDLVVNSMRQILEYMEKSGALEQFDETNRTFADFILSGCGDRLSGEPLSEEVYEALSCLWDSSLVKDYYARREEYGLNDSVGYFMDSLPRIYEKDFQPVHEDLMMAYIPTVGVQDFEFHFNKHEYQVFDVGRAKLDAHKWSTIYENLDAVIFTMAISTYDQRAEEVEQFVDDIGEGGEAEVRSIKRPTQLESSLQLLSQIVSEAVFALTPIHVFLNECDVFKEKLGRVKLEDFFPEYSGTSEKDALEYMKQFVKTAADAASGDKRAAAIEYHFTTCTNTKEMQKLLAHILKHLDDKK